MRIPSPKDIQDRLASPSMELGPLLPELVCEEIWLLLSAGRQLERQRWLAEVVEKRLGGNLEAIGSVGAFAHPDPAHGTVPGLTEWEFHFHGVGCCLTHRSEGTTIDVDFHDGSFRSIDYYFFTTLLQSLRNPELPEKRIIHEGPMANAWRVDLEKLSQEELVSCDGPVFRLTPTGEKLYRTLLPVLDTLNKDKRADLALALGDAELAVSLGWFDPVRSEEQRQSRFRNLRERPTDEFVLQALAALKTTESFNQLLGSVREPSSMSSLITAMELLEYLRDPGDQKPFWSLLPHLTGGDRPYHFARLVCCRCLLTGLSPVDISSPQRQQLLDILGDLHEAFRAEAGILAYLLEPKLGLSYLTDALKSSVPITRKEAAALLLEIGSLKALKPLLDQLESSSAELAREAAYILEESSDPGAWEKARKWKSQNPRPESARQDPSLEDVLHSNFRSWLLWTRKRMRERYAELLARWCRRPPRD